MDPRVEMAFLTPSTSPGENLLNSGSGRSAFALLQLVHSGLGFGGRSRFSIVKRRKQEKKRKKKCSNHPTNESTRKKKRNQTECSGVGVNQEDGKRLGWFKHHQFVKRGVRWSCPQWVAVGDLS